MPFDENQPRDDQGQWTAGDSGDAIRNAASDKSIDKRLNSLTQKTEKELNDAGMSDDYIYRDYEGINNGTPTSLLKSASELRSKFGSPIFTKLLFGKSQEMPSEVKQYIQDNGKSQLDKIFKNIEVKRIKLSNIIPVQRFVFEKAIKNANINKALEIIKSKGNYIVIDGNHSLSKSFIMGETHVNAKVIDID